jgi:hypothetical protein
VPEGTVGRIRIAGKDRPAVVLEVQSKPSPVLRVIYGTTEPHDWPREVVTPDSRQGRLLQLAETTYFYGANTAYVVPDELTTLHPRRASPELVYALRSLALAYREVQGRADPP